MTVQGNSAAAIDARRGALAGLRVLDISRFIAGPYAGQVLGHLGADVVKVEEPGEGDPMRHLSKYSAADGSAHFLSGNASKRSVTLNLRSADGKAAFSRLLASCDVLIENFRPGVMERLGLGSESLLQAHPRLIIASVTGFGQTGPWKNWAAYDLIAQAVGGGMSLTGWPGESAAKMGVPIGDVGASLFGVIGILAALHRRERSGRGEFIDISMMDVQLSLLNYHAHYFWLSGVEPQPEGDAHPNVVPYQTFQTEDRPLVAAVYGDPFWPGFCRALALEELTEDARFATNRLRHANKAQLLEILVTRFATRAREYWLARLIANGVPAGPLNSVGEAVSSEQARARDMVVQVNGSDAKPLNLLGSPLKFHGCDTRVTAPPQLGAHTAEVLQEWAGFGADEVEALRKTGSI
jgi:crotonobetainyl-CoA:carnitine CoA-transferase CaiB-like acyl-CoA transferase